MIKEVKLPQLGENVESGTVTKILVKEGDRVSKEQPVIEIENEKAVAEVPSPYSGTVKEILIEENKEIKVGAVLFKLEVGEEAEDTKEEAPKAPKEEKQEEQKEEAGTKEEKPEKKETRPSPKPEPERPPQPSAQKTREVPAPPSVRRFAREIGIDVSRVPGTGRNGRISIEDVKEFAKEVNTGREQARTGGTQAYQETLPDFTKWGEVERQPMTQIRAKTAQHLSYGWTSIPHVTQFDKADITDLENLRKRYAKKAEKQGAKLTVTAFILKVIASALKIFPRFNASVDMAERQVIFKKYIHIGVAVDTDRGLLVPVIRDADKKSIIELAKELVEISDKARQKKLALEDMQGGTFTVTNLGGIGGLFFTPIINAPEVAILGVSRAVLEPSYNGGTCNPRLMLPLSLSYDHRVIDGADGARFLRWVCEAIKQPFLMELDG